MIDKENKFGDIGRIPNMPKSENVITKINSRAGSILNLEKEEELIKSVIDEIQSLNPDIKILCEETLIFCDTPEKLKLPEGFYFSEINGITNKNIKESGVFVSITVYPHRIHPDFNKKKEEK